LAEARSLLDQHRIRHLPVVEDGNPVGIITDRDIRSAAPASSLGQVKVGEIMTRDVIVGSPHDDLITVASTMTEKRIRHLPVVDKGRLIGIVTLGDVVKAQRDQYRGEVDTLQIQIMEEQT